MTPMPSTFQRLMAHWNELLHSQAVWTDVVQYLQKYLDTDAGPATRGITNRENVVVPQAMISAIIAEIQLDKLGPIGHEINEIEACEEVADGPKAEDVSKTRKNRRTRSQQAEGDGSGNGGNSH